MGLEITSCARCGKRMMVSDMVEDKKKYYFCSRKGCEYV